MPEWFRQWLLGVIACAMLVSFAGQLCPKGGAKKTVRFTGGLLLLLAVLRPLAQLELWPETQNAPDYRAAVAQLELELGEVREKAEADGIAVRLEAYIEDKARSMGTSVRAAVTLEVRDGVPVLVGVTLHGAYNQQLSAWLTEELGLAKEKQEWIENG